VADEEDDSDGPISGPYCEHWADPSDCDEVCAACGRKCRAHDSEENNDCPKFQNEE
jgi:hypothetical protein